MSEKPVFSIALCTYNGAYFLSEQLASFVAQTHQPDELVICDDGSTDETLDIVKRFAESAPFPVHVHINTSRLGPTLNFSRAISLCGGELIALSDQDDVWHPKKLECLHAAFLQRHEISGLFSNAEVVGAGLEPLGYSMWQTVGFDVRQQEQVIVGKAFPILLRHACVTGCTFAFRSTFRTKLLPIPSQWQHDAWLALLLATGPTRLGLVPKMLVKYRQHGTNVTGGRNVTLGKRIQRANEIGRFGYLHIELARWEALRSRLDNFADIEDLKRLDEKIGHLQYRLSMPQIRIFRLPFVLREWISGRYLRCSKDWTSVASDLLMV